MALPPQSGPRRVHEEDPAGWRGGFTHSLKKEKEAFLDDDAARDAETDPAGAAAALAAAFGDEEGDASPSDASPSRASGSAREDEDEEDDEDAPAAGDLDAYLNDLLGGSSDEDDEDAEDAEDGV